MNKGLEIRNKKLAKKASKARTKKDSQIGVVRFVDFRYHVIDRVNGKYAHKGNATIQGLQVENRIYMADGHYKLVNSKGAKVVRTYPDIPDWANEFLIDKYREKRGADDEHPADAH